MNAELKKLVELEMSLYLGGEYSDSKMAQWSLEAFAESVVRLCSANILTSSDRHRREYFAESLLKDFDV